MNWIWSYYQGIQEGTYNVGRYIKLLYKYLIDGIEEGLFLLDLKKANEAIDWIESHCYHTEGPLAPSLLKLSVWQKAFISAIFGIVDDAGRRQFREVVLLVGRKNGKTKLASSISEYVWRQEGGYGTRVFCLAPKLEQTDLVYDDIWRMCELDPEYQDLKEMLSEKDQHNKRIYDDSVLPRHRRTDLSIPSVNSTVKKLAFSAKKSDGFNPSLAIMDEVSSWEGDRGLKQYEVIRSGMGARPEGLILSCTTSGYINDSIFDELMKRATRFLLGDSEEKRLLPVLYMIDDLDKWSDINELYKSNPNLGTSVSVDYMLEEIAVANGSLSRKAEFITKYCNIKQNSSLALLPSKVIEGAVSPGLDLCDFCGSYCVAGVDLSRTTDLSSAVVMLERASELFIFAHFWLPADKIEEAQQTDGVPYQIYIEKGYLTPSGSNFIDYRDVFDWFRSLVEELEIYPLVVGYDRYSATYLVQEMENYGFNLDDVYQGDNLYGCIQEVVGLMEDGKVHFDNDLLKIHLYNSAVKMNQNRGRGKLVKIRPTAHIDGMAALLDSMAVRQKHYNQIGEQLRNEEEEA